MAVLLIESIFAVSVWAIAVAAAHGKIPPNGFAGIRVRATRRSPKAWRAGHRAASFVLGPAAVAVALISLGLALTHPWGVGGMNDAASILMAGYLLVGSLAVLAACRAANRTDDHDSHHDHAPMA